MTAQPSFLADVLIALIPFGFFLAFLVAATWIAPAVATPVEDEAHGDTTGFGDRRP